MTAGARRDRSLDHPAIEREAAMRPSRAELVDLLASVLPEGPSIPTGFLSESALAELLRVDRRWIRMLRGAGTVSPRRFGRGFVYAAPEARVCAVAARLFHLGLSLDEIVGFFAAPCDPATCPPSSGRCSACDCCARLLATHLARLETDIADLHRLERALTGRAPAPAVAGRRRLHLVASPDR